MDIELNDSPLHPMFFIYCSVLFENVVFLPLINHVLKVLVLYMSPSIKCIFMI